MWGIFSLTKRMAKLMLVIVVMITMVASKNAKREEEGDDLKIAEGSAFHKDTSH